MFFEAGVVAYQICSPSYGVHYGMRNTTEKARKEFNRGYDVAKANSAKGDFEYGIEMAKGVVDYADAMMEDIGHWKLASREMHKGFWFTEVDRWHKNRQRDGADADYIDYCIRRMTSAYTQIKRIYTLD